MRSVYSGCVREGTKDWGSAICNKEGAARVAHNAESYAVEEPRGGGSLEGFFEKRDNVKGNTEEEN